VRYSRGIKLAGIEPRTYGTVVAINPAENLLTIQKAAGYQVSYDPRRLSGASVYREIEREFSVGDRIQFTAPDKSLGVANRDMGAIEAIHPDGRLSARLDNNRQIEFNPNEHRHLDHGYAVTSHSSQGLTAERVLVHADTSVHPDLLNSRFGDVSISRASHEATLFTDDMAKLGPQLGADVSKTSALEITQASCIAQGIGLGELLALEYAGCPLPDELNMQRAAAPGVVAVGALANVRVVTPPNGECHEVSSPSEYGFWGNPHGGVRTIVGTVRRRSQDYSGFMRTKEWLLR
jgi:hypothetical protein